MADFGCSFPDCDRHPSKGDTILRISAKGTPFVGRCEEHYGEGGEAPPVECVPLSGADQDAS